MLPNRTNAFPILETRVPSLKNCWFPNLGTNGASQSWNLGFSGSQTFEPMLPNVGTSGSQFYKLTVPKPWKPMFPNLGTNVSRSWNLGFLGASGSQTLESLFSKLGTLGSQLYQLAIVSKAATISSELRSCLLQELHISMRLTICLEFRYQFYSRATLQKGFNIGIRFNIHV